MSLFNVSAWDINTNAKIADLQGVTNLSYSVRMNDAGEFGFQLNLTDHVARASAQQVMSMNGTPFKVLVTTNLDTLILYSGIAWQTSRSPSSGMLTVGGKAMPSYFAQILIANSYTTSIAPTDLMKAVILDAQRATMGANRGINPVVLGYNAPPNVVPSYNVSQYTTVAQVIADMTAAATPGVGGVDYFMLDYFNQGLPQHQFTIVTPRCGRIAPNTNLSVNLMQCIDWTWPTEGTGAGNQVIVVGGGTGGRQPVATANAAAPRGGLGQMPLMQEVLQYSHITNQTQLQTIANGCVQQVGQPITTPTVTIPATYKACPLGEFQIGDDIRLWSGPSVWFPNGMTQWWRIASYTVTIPDEGVPTVTLTLNVPPVF